MKIIDILNKNKVTVSLELFPPKPGESLEDARETVRETAALNPSFISVTYGAGGGTSKTTVEIADAVQNTNGVPVLAHLTCVGATQRFIKDTLTDMRAHNITNILALRGDPPAELVSNDNPFQNYRYASELAAEIRSHGDFCIGGACYVEGHPESPTLQADIDNLKIKVENGCQFLTSQMFFDNNRFYNFMFRLLRSGVNVPVVAGVMPVTNAAQIERIFTLSGTALPPHFKAMADRFIDNPAALRQAGLAYATEQIIDLIANGVNHIHIYIMNRPGNAKIIMRNLNKIFE
jgi:methylenetetrahydrofolate reductase (NADPH)